MLLSVRRVSVARILVRILARIPCAAALAVDLAEHSTGRRHSEKKALPHACVTVPRSAGVSAGDPGAGCARLGCCVDVWACSCVQYLSNRIKCIDKLTGGPFLE